MKDATLHIVTAISNPIRWRSRVHLARKAIANWLLEPNVHVTLVECAHGSRSYCLADLDGPRVTHVPVRAYSLAWTKENLLNIGIARLPQDAKYIGTFDADIHFREPGWAMETLHALQIYPVVQPWRHCYDLGPTNGHLQVHTSFASLFHHGDPVVAEGRKKFWEQDGGPYAYAHCLPGDTLVVPGGKVLAASSRPYEGNLVTIRTATGKQLSCTPSHPIFSNGKWVRADALTVGDNVVNYDGGDTISSQPDEKYTPTPIQDIVGAFSEKVGVHQSCISLPDNFNNEFAESKVTTVWSDSPLRDERNPSFRQQLGDFLFRRVFNNTLTLDSPRGPTFFRKGFPLSLSSDQSSLARYFSSLFGSHLGHHTLANAFGNLSPSLATATVPSSLSIPTSFLESETGSSFFNLPSSLFGREIGPSQSDVFTGTSRQLSAAEHITNLISAETSNSRDFFNSLSRSVQDDRIVDIGRRHFSGHVYDLKTEHECIIAQDLVTHNSGFAWCWVREVLDKIGGLFEVGGMGSGDYHMALGLIGAADYSLILGISDSYRRNVKLWENRALVHVNQKIGYVHGTIEHHWHGNKQRRAYILRWNMFITHKFDPDTDLKLNTYRVLEFAGNKPSLERIFDRYLRDRCEDSNCNL